MTRRLFRGVNVTTAQYAPYVMIWAMPILPLNFLSLAPLFLCGGKEKLHAVALGVKVPDFDVEGDMIVLQKQESWRAACFVVDVTGSFVIGITEVSTLIGHGDGELAELGIGRSLGPRQHRAQKRTCPSQA